MYKVISYVKRRGEGAAEKKASTLVSKENKHIRFNFQEMLMFLILFAGVDLHFCSHFSAVFGHLRRGQVREGEVDEIASNFAKGGALPRTAAARTPAAFRARVSKELFAIERLGSRANHIYAAGLRVIICNMPISMQGGK